MADDARLPLTRARPGELASAALVVGDPARAAQAAELLTEAREVASNREYVTYTGEYENRRVSVCSHGVGAAGAGVCFEELVRGGVRTIVRAGTCGALQDALEDGDLVVATAAVRDEGLTPRLVPIGFPAIADLEVSRALVRLAESSGRPVHRGVVLTTDLFYPSRVRGQNWKPWQEARVVAVEMELSALFVVAALHGVRAGGVMAVDGNPTRAAADMSEYDPYRAVVGEGKADMLRVALKAVSEFAQTPRSSKG